MGVGEGEFNYPLRVTVDGENQVYVTDFHDHRIQVFTQDGEFLRKWGSYGSGDGQLNVPFEVAIGPTGKAYVTDLQNHRVQVFTPEGEFLRKWGL